MLAWFREEVRQSIALLKCLRAMGKALKLKLYADPPLVKMVILWIISGSSITMPTSTFRPCPSMCYATTARTMAFTRSMRITSSSGGTTPTFPNLETDELVYRTRSGGEVRRDTLELDFIEKEASVTPSQASRCINARRDPLEVGGVFPVKGETSALREAIS